MDTETPKKYSPKKTRDILAAARHQFLAQGFKGATMDGIALEAGVSKQTLYNRYPDKQALFSAILSGLIEDLAKETGDVAIAINTLDDLHQTLRLIGRTMVTTIADSTYLNVMRTVLPEFHNYPDLRILFRKSMPDRILGVLTHIFDTAGRNGLIQTVQPEIPARLFAGSLLTYILQRGVLGEKHEVVMTDVELDNLIQQLLEMLRRQ